MNCNEELSYKIIQSITKAMPILETDMQKQLEIKRIIDIEIYEYEVLSRCTSLTFSDIKEKASYYLMCKKMKGLNEKTIASYMLLLNKFASCLNKPVNSITPGDIRRFIVETCQNNSPDTINNKILMLNDFFTFLQNEEIIIKNPMSKIEKVKSPKRKRKGLTPEEQELMRNACRTQRQKAVYEFFLSTGCRVSEVSNVKISDINWYNRTLYVIGKGNKERLVKFSTKCKIELEEYIKTRKGDSQYLFIGERFPYEQLQPRALQCEIKKIAKNSKVECNVFCHKLRHTFATSAVNSDVSLPALQALMGHSSPNTTQIYYELSSETLSKEYNKINS